MGKEIKELRERVAGLRFRELTRKYAARAFTGRVN